MGSTKRTEIVLSSKRRKTGYYSLARTSMLCLIAWHLRLDAETRSICEAADSPPGPWPAMGSPSQYSSFSGRRGSLASGNPNGAGKFPREGRSRAVPDSSPCPTPCNFFLWNFVSFFKYKETVFRAEQNTFEGKGGKKFVRVQENTLLERWYPQLREGRLGTDRCLLCGCSWNDHLGYWWHRQRKRRCDVSAFESYTAKDGDGDDELAFHKRYVDVVSQSKSGKSRKNGREIRKSLGAGVSYSIPPFNPDDKSVGSVFLLALGRMVSLVKLEDLMWYEEVESTRRGRRAT